MPGTTRLGATTASQRAMLRNLITLGTALSSDSWGDDLQRISGVGPKYESVLQAEGVTTFGQLGGLDGELRARLERALEQYPLADLDEWIEAAGILAGEYEPVAVVSEFDTETPAKAYLRMIQQHQGRPIDRHGMSHTVVRLEDGPAVLRRFNAFDAPAGHPAIAAFVAALRAFVAATEGTARIPSFDAEHLSALRAVLDSLTKARD
jgi:predicted flap endonuclease-1-like 5' DNA nuclease